MSDKNKFNNIIPEGYSKDLTVENSDDLEMIELTTKFVISLEDDYNNFIKNLKNAEKENEKYLNNSNIIFTPEKISRKSPLTIINAPWGTGKTYFIERVIKNFFDEKIKSKKIENLILIDCWKYSDCKDVPEEIVAEIIANLWSFLDDSKEKKEKMKKFIISFFNSTVLSWFNKKTGFNIKEIEIKKNDYKKNLDILFPTTIIFLDNIERIGKDSWQVLKAIYKIQQLKGLIIILSMNMNYLSHSNNFESEYPIEKFIDIKYYNFKQNYSPLLSKMNFNLSDVENINKILDKEIDGKKLTVRELEQRLMSNKILSIDNKYQKYFLIYKKIWKNYEIIEALIDKDFLLFSDFLTKKIKINKNYNSILLNDLMNNLNFIESLIYENFSDIKSNFLIEKVVNFKKIIKENNDFLFKNETENEGIDEIYNLNKGIVEKLEKFQKTLNNKINKIQKKINDAEENILGQELKIKEFQRKIDELETLKKDIDFSDVAIWEKAIEKTNVYILELKEKKEEFFREKSIYSINLDKNKENNFYYYYRKIKINLDSITELRNNYKDIREQYKNFKDDIKMFFSKNHHEIIKFEQNIYKDYMGDNYLLKEQFHEFIKIKYNK